MNSNTPENLAPVQGDLSVCKYFELIEAHAMALGVDLENEKIREKFISGLLPKNRIEAIRCGIKRPIMEIVDHLNVITRELTDIQKFRLGCLEQGNDSVMEYFTKLDKCNKSLGFEKGHLDNQFLRGLTFDNQLEVNRCGLDLPLEELVERLSAIENIRKNEILIASGAIKDPFFDNNHSKK